MLKIAVIPARGGSKRIPKKNIRSFHGKPIIGYSIAAAQESQLFDQIIVSTDSDEIAQVAESLGASAPFRRPAELANDFAPTIPVIRHAVEQVEAQSGQKVGFVCCIYATAPFVSSHYLKEGFRLISGGDLDYAFSATKFPFPIQRAFFVSKEGRVELAYPEFEKTRSQDLPEGFHDAGQFYWGTADAFKKERPIFSLKSAPVVLPTYLVQDIDTLDDWKRAEYMKASLDGDVK